MSKISAYAQNTSPGPDFVFIGTDTANTSMAASGTTQVVPKPSLGQAITGRYNVIDYGADPTGATECHTGIQAAITAAAASPNGSGTVYFPPGTYSISAGFDLPTNVMLLGDYSVGGTVSNVRKGAVLAVSSSFSGSYVLGISEVADATVNGATVKGLMIYGGSYTTAAVDGIKITGPAMTYLRDLRITRMSGWGINTTLDLSASEVGPYGQDYDNVLCDSNGTVSGGGVNLVYAEDSTFRDVYCIGNNNGPGFQITGCDNSHFTDCRAEWNSGANGYGFWITNQTVSGSPVDWTYATGTCQFSNCSTDRNALDGVKIDGTWQVGAGAGTGPCNILMTGLSLRRDGKANNGATGSYAGLSITGTTLPVVVCGFASMTGVDDGGSGNISPRYGIYISGVASNVPILLGPGIAWGYSAGLSGTATGLVTTAINQQTGSNSASTI